MSKAHVVHVRKTFVKSLFKKCVQTSLKQHGRCMLLYCTARVEITNAAFDKRGHYERTIGQSVQGKRRSNQDKNEVSATCRNMSVHGSVQPVFRGGRLRGHRVHGRERDPAGDVHHHQHQQRRQAEEGRHLDH